MATSIRHRLEQAEALVAEKQAAYEKEKASIKTGFRKAKALKNPADRKGEIAFLNMKVGAAEDAADELITAKDKLIAIYNEDLRAGFERMHGLLSYGISMGRTSPDARLLLDSLGDYLESKTESDRKAAHKAINLCLEHGNLDAQEGGESARADDEVLRRLEALSDPEQRTAFYNKNRDEIHRAFEARKNNNP